MAKMSLFMAFWAGYNTARRSCGLPDVLYGEANRVWRSYEQLQDDCSGDPTEAYESYHRNQTAEGDY